MNKVLIRARQIDNNKQLPILIRENDDLSDFNEYSNISRSSQILSGMDKSEESELHLQEVLRELQYEKTTANTAIPIPEVHEKSDYDTLYRSDFICPKNYIRLKTLEFEDECPEYDLDEEDQEWLDNSKLEVTALKFEKIVEEFERACSQKALLLDEAKSLLRNEKVHIVIAIYDYWLTKRVRTGQPLFLSVKAEKAERCNNTPIDPYIAFRKRSEKMTTRKNRRVDESSYEKMYRLRRHMEKLSEIIEFVSQREATKSEITATEREIFIKRYESREYDKLQSKESDVSLKHNQSLKLSDNFKSAQRSREENHHKEARRKRCHSSIRLHDPSVINNGDCRQMMKVGSSDRQESINDNIEGDNDEQEMDFTFRPMAKCKYLANRWSTPDEEKSDNNISRSSRQSEMKHISSIDPHKRRCLPQTLSSPLLSSSPAWPARPSTINRALVNRIYTLYHLTVNSGLLPLSSSPPPPPTSLQYIKPIRTTTGIKLLPLVSVTNNNHHISPQYLTATTIHQKCHNHQIDSIATAIITPSDLSDSRYSETKCQNPNCTQGLCTNQQSSLGSLDPVIITCDTQKNCLSPQSSVSHHYESLSSPHKNGKLCTYQSVLVSSPDHNQNHAFTDSEPSSRNLGQKRSSSIEIKELFDSHTNQKTLNGNTFSAKLSQVVGLSCLKSLSKKHLVPPDDIDEIANFYSKSNGHHNTYYHHHNNNHISNNHYNKNNSYHKPKTTNTNNNNNSGSSSKWLKQTSTDSCLMRPSPLLPIWKSEPHVMTSVNKMT